MPSGFQKGIGMGASGAGIGASFGGPIGAAFGGGVGFLAGLFSGSDEEPQYISPSFADINLATENPELYKELMRMQASANEAERMYNQRRQGMTYTERAGLNEGLSNQVQQQANQGLLGSSAGAAMQADMEARLRDQIQRRAYQEQMGLFQNMAQQRAQQAGVLSGAQNQIMGLKTHGADQDYNQAMGNELAANQFYSGLFNGGLGMLGQYQNMQNMQAMGNGQPANQFYASGVPGQDNWSPQGTGYPMYSGNNYGYGGH